MGANPKKKSSAWLMMRDYANKRTTQANEAEEFRQLAKDTSVWPDMEIDTRINEKLSKHAQERSEDFGERERRMGSVLNQRKAK